MWMWYMIEEKTLLGSTLLKWRGPTQPLRHKTKQKESKHTRSLENRQVLTHHHPFLFRFHGIQRYLPKPYRSRTPFSFGSLFLCSILE